MRWERVYETAGHERDWHHRTRSTDDERDARLSRTADRVGVKVGFEQFVANAARDYGLLYGLATSMMAILTGWFTSVVFRRD